ncbi:MAG: primosomal protein N' [Cyanobacteria bacterium P01_E01_bin.6]
MQSTLSLDTVTRRSPHPVAVGQAVVGPLEVASLHTGQTVSEASADYETEESIGLNPHHDCCVAAQWVEVLVDCPGAQGLYTYAIPAPESIKPGDILSVRFGSQFIGAIAIHLCDSPPADLDPATIKPIDDVVSRGFFPAHYWELLQAVADYYCTPLIQVIRGALPPGLLGRSKRRVRLVPDALPTGAREFLQPAAQHILDLIQSKPTTPYTWAYLQRQERYGRQALQDLAKRGWIESYLEAPTPVQPKHRLAVTLGIANPDVCLSRRQQDVLDVLQRQGGDAWLQELLQISQVSSSVVYALEKKGCVVVEPREMLRRDQSGQHLTDRPKVLTPAQATAVKDIQSLVGAHRVLLHGVTGSGKTEVYLQAIAPIVAQGKSVLVLVPEIGLTPQLTDRFRARFGSDVQVYHSGLSQGERYDTWRQMLLGTPQIVIGTRSAIFSPLANLGLIILDEEHDSSFKQDQPAPCYHARTVAEWRADLEQCPLILGSATPALESWHDVHPLNPASNTNRDSELHGINTGRPQLSSHYLSLPDRIHNRPLPPIQVVDMRTEFREGNRSMFSGSLRSALETLQEKQERGILFMHRRGHSTFVSCRSCGEALICPHCDVSLTYHQTHEGATPTVRCHYCGYGRSHPSTCPACDSSYLKHFGSGTQRIIQELNRQFPDLRCLRYDRDTTRTKGAHRALMTRFAQGDADVLIGTQMIAKGIDIPQVTLVGIVSADGLLNLPDFRAAERAYQTLTQVAGRAGRGQEPGRVILQTYTPEHPVIQAVQHQDFAAFITHELGDRQALQYPPYGQLILLRLSSSDRDAVQQAATQLGDRLRPQNPDTSTYQLLGPAPASVMRLARRYRWQLLFKCYPGDAGRLIQQLKLEQVRSLVSKAVSITIDVDPMTML